MAMAFSLYRRPVSERRNIMWFSSWLRAKSPSTAGSPSRRRKHTPARRARPVLEQLEDRLAPSAGQLDPTFGQGGLVTTNIGGPTSTSAQAVVVAQPDGKVVVV